MWIAQCANTITPKTELLRLNSWTKTNAFFSSSYSNDNRKVSDWIHLTKGEPYYLEASYVEYNGGDHMNTGVEFEQTAIVNHHQAMKEIQELKITTDQTKEQSVIDVKNPDSGTFKLLFKHPKTNKFIPSGSIKCDDTTTNFNKAIKAYYWNRATYRLTTRVTKVKLDSDGIDITISNGALDTIRYTIEVIQLQSSPTTTQIIVSK